MKGWSRTYRKGTQSKITVDHLLASSAIPFLFEAVKINREYFGDGSIRQTAPFSLPIHLGADAVLAIGSREQQEKEPQRSKTHHYPSLGQIAGYALDSVFLDSLQSDMERVMRINHTISLIPEHEKEENGVNLRTVDTMMINPSGDIGEIAQRHFKELPWTVRSLMRGLGGRGEGGSSNLLSYLMFEKGYCRELIDMGYQDTLARRKEVEMLLGYS